MPTLLAQQGCQGQQRDQIKHYPNCSSAQGGRQLTNLSSDATTRHGKSCSWKDIVGSSVWFLLLFV
jgi:hypothetical protein